MLNNKNFKYKKTWLITGGAGFIGSNLTEYLLKNNQKVIILAKKVAEQANKYREQLNKCKKKLNRNKYIISNFVHSKIYKMKNIKYLLYSIVTLISFSISAQEETTEDEPTFSVAGSIDTYFRSNDYAPGTSFANKPGFALGMANVILSYEGEKSGFVADFVYGPRGVEAVFNSSGSSNIVNQLYAYLNVSDNFTLTLGNWNTFLGYEVISPVANFNYSTSYMFSYGPFSVS